VTIKVVWGAGRCADDFKAQELEGPDLVMRLDKVRRDVGSGRRKEVMRS
jgi:hypothetical protein